MRDVDPVSDDRTPYECFECGKIIVAADRPSYCPDCGGPMRNRRTPLE
jgi:rubrerythrin